MTDSLGKQLMDFIDKGVIAIQVDDNGTLLPGWRWRNEAEAGINAFLDEWVANCRVCKRQVKDGWLTPHGLCCDCWQKSKEVCDDK